MVRGVGRFARNQRLQELESIDSVLLLDPLDVSARIEELSGLQDGWLDGEGFAPDQEGLQWFRNAFEQYYDVKLVLPRLYPTAEGGIQAEWTCPNKEISLEVQLATKQASYQALDTVSLVSNDLDIDLSSDTGWKVLNERLGISREWFYDTRNATATASEPFVCSGGKSNVTGFSANAKDQDALSVDNGDMISPQDAWQRFVDLQNCRSVGVLAVCKKECDEQELPVIEDGIPFPEHCSIDFVGFTKSATEKKAKILKILAERRGWLHQA
jgi:hypothetical protein